MNITNLIAEVKRRALEPSDEEIAEVERRIAAGDTRHIAKIRADVAADLAGHARMFTQRECAQARLYVEHYATAEITGIAPEKKGGFEFL